MGHNLAILGAAALMAAASLVQPGTAAELQTYGGAGQVVVHHGSTVEVVPARPPSSGVTVLRGTGRSLPVEPSELEKLRGILEKSAELRVAAGEDGVWLLDRAGGRLINCSRLMTSRVGRDRISCVQRKLR